MSMKSMSAIPDSHGHILEAMPSPTQARFLYFKADTLEPRAVAMQGFIESASVASMSRVSGLSM